MLHFIYLVSDRWKDHLRYEWLYVYRMAKFYQYWLKKSLRLHYDVKCSVMVVDASRLTRWRFGMQDIIKDHKEKGENNYHIYLSYFKPLLSDCSVGYYLDRIGLVKWRYYEGNNDLVKFLAEENCSKVSHIILHEVARNMRKEERKKYYDAIHEQWDRHIMNIDEFEYYNERYERVSKSSNFMFATMKVPKQ
ncbi:MAG: hypothetical protein QW416_05485 [Candidatus Nitrosocaldaceae archaeon]